MRLHLGCGKKYKAGWTNIDGAYCGSGKHPDLIMDLAKPLPFEDNTVREIMAIHIFEHFYRGDVSGILSDWYRVIKSGGRLVLEMPDIYKAAKNLVAEVDSGKEPSDTWALFPIFGDNPNKTEYDCHKYGWTFKTLEPLLKEAGFNHVTEHPTQTHGRRQNRDFRLEAVKL